MLFRITVISNESDDFMMEIQMDSDATFYQLHQLIIDACGYEEDKLASFTFCTEDWQRVQDITLVEMEADADVDTFIMEKTRLSEFLEDEKEHLIYTFDPMAGRCLFMELTEIAYGQTVEKPIVTRKAGTPPPQYVDFDEFMEKNPMVVQDDIDEDLYGQGISQEDFDLEGLDISEGDPFS